MERDLHFSLAQAVGEIETPGDAMTIRKHGSLARLVPSWPT